MADKVFELAARYRSYVINRDNSLHDVVKGYTVAILLFYEVSTRTANSFVAAMQHLGGTVFRLDERTSSANKGETFEGGQIDFSLL